MRSMKKPLFLLLALAVLVSVSVYATVAYFTDSEDITNTFTVGKVNITLDEEKVNPDGTDPDPNTSTRTEDGNQYHLVPGKTYIKDPTVTVLAGSEPSFVRMTVTINNYSEISAMLPGFMPENYVNGTWNSEIWPCCGITTNPLADTITYEFRYHQVVAQSNANQVLEPLFASFTIPGELTGEQLNQLNQGIGDPANPASLNAFEIVIQGHAIQQTGFDDVNKAWEAFDAQYAGANS